MPGVSCGKCGERFYWTEHGEKICPKCNLLSRTAFHVWFIENGVEQEQIFLGVPDGNGGFNISVPTPCVLLSVRQHGFPYCEVCDAVSERTLGVEKEPEAGFNAPQRIEFPQLPNAWPHACAFDFDDRAARIRAEVEAMDWPEVIGE